MVRLHTRPVCYLALFGCNLAVIFVTHKSMMTIPTQTVWTPPWYATIPDLLRVHAVPVFPKIWWWCINNFVYLPVRIYVSMCLSCFLVRWSVICCQDGCFIVRQRRIARRWWALFERHKAYLVPFLPWWGGTIDPWALRFLVVREIDCGDWLARGYMPAHQHCDLFYPLVGNLIGSTIN